ncbi:hypothetical protein MVEN_00781200 [Mycena venus]|uniref:DUF6534 domain-containing protein n=1 Tax=Mycena venus TaxID=2733690 RepID=A0A8H7D392_9AGAR|nr:hypothetical protein MVEN_00781200 [Mycena venus]
MPPVPSFDPNATLGALQIGVLVSYALFGVTTTQAYIYYTRFPEDSPKIKAMVAFIWFAQKSGPRVFLINYRICELAHAICIGHTLYVSTISDFGHPERLVRAPESLSTAILFSGVVGPCVQAFFAFRIYRLSRSLWIPCVCWTLSFLRMLGSFSVFVFALQMVTLVAYEAQWGWLLSTILAVGATVDLIIASTLVYLLVQQRENSHKSTVATVDKLIKWTIETGVCRGDHYVGLCSSLSLSLWSLETLISFKQFLTMKDNYIWLGWFVVLARLFSNSLFASLNSRATLRAMKEDVVALCSTGPPKFGRTNFSQMSNGVESTKFSDGTQGSSKTAME